MSMLVGALAGHAVGSSGKDSLKAEVENFKKMSEALIDMSLKVESGEIAPDQITEHMKNMGIDIKEETEEIKRERKKAENKERKKELLNDSVGYNLGGFIGLVGAGAAAYMMGGRRRCYGLSRYHRNGDRFWRWI